MNKTQAMLFLLAAEEKAFKAGDIIRAAKIRVVYLSFCEGFYDDIFEEVSYDGNSEWD
jgi:hypothetical protein